MRFCNNKNKIYICLETCTWMVSCLFVHTCILPKVSWNCKFYERHGFIISKRWDVHGTVPYNMLRTNREENRGRLHIQLWLFDGYVLFIQKPFCNP